jgi:hypothetical protein
MKAVTVLFYMLTKLFEASFISSTVIFILNLFQKFKNPINIPWWLLLIFLLVTILASVIHKTLKEVQGEDSQ